MHRGLNVLFNQVLSLLLLLLLLPVLCDSALHARGGGEEHRTGGAGRARPFALVSTAQHSIEHYGTVQHYSYRTVPESSRLVVRLVQLPASMALALVMVTAKRVRSCCVYRRWRWHWCRFLSTSAGLRLVTAIDVGGGSTPPSLPYSGNPVCSRSRMPLRPHESRFLKAVGSDRRNKTLPALAWG